MKIKLQLRKKGSQLKELHADRLHGLKEEFQKKSEETLTIFLGNSSGVLNPQSQWQHLRTILQKKTAEVARYRRRKNRDWFDKNDTAFQDLLQKKHTCYERLLSKPDNQAAKAAKRRACSIVQSKLRELQNNLWVNLAEQTQPYADMGNT